MARQVTAALIERDGKILLALRKAGKNMGRKWEFPGGKLHPGETPEECLRRELAEELAVDTRIGELLGSTRYAVGDIDLEIHLYRAEYLSGTFTLHEHEAIAWVTPEELASYDLADSDRKLARLIVRREQ